MTLDDHDDALAVIVGIAALATIALAAYAWPWALGR